MDSNNSSIKRFCGNYDNEDPLVVSSVGNKMLVKFDSDRLFRYKGFQCRYRAMQANGISVINSFVDETQGNLIVLNSEFSKLYCFKFQNYLKYDCISSIYRAPCSHL